MTRQCTAIRSNQKNRRTDRQESHKIIHCPTESEAPCRIGGAFCVKMAGGDCGHTCGHGATCSCFMPPLKGGAFTSSFSLLWRTCGHGTPCPYRACCKITGTDNKKHRAETERFQNRCPEKAAPAERSWRGVLRGHVPSKSLSADSEIPCAMLLAHGEGG